jgi:hypothetical protein
MVGSKDLCAPNASAYTSSSVGRRNWGIPKHLARFSFERLANPHCLKVQVFPPHPSIETPFFTTTLQPFTWIPPFSFASKIAPYLGYDLHLTQPPLPASDKPGEEEICGTDKWMKTLPIVVCKKAKGCWVSVQQPIEGDDKSIRWWPKVEPFKMGLWLEGTDLTFGEPEVLSLIDTM